MSDTPRTDAQVTGNCTPTQDEANVKVRELEDEIERLKLFECQNMGGYILWDDKKWWACHLLSKREQEAREANEKLHKAMQECVEVEQTLGKALGYPWYKDDPKNFPIATEADGVCVGEHTPATIAAEAASRLEKATTLTDRDREILQVIVDGWVRANVSKMRDALESIRDAEDPKDMYDTAKETLETLFPLTATQRGFKVGKVYRLKFDAKQCTYHIVSDTHYTAVFVDGSQEPKVSTVDMLGFAEDYEVVE